MPFQTLSGRNKELTPKELHRQELKRQWQEKRAAIMADYDKDPNRFRLQEWELPAGILHGAKSDYAALYRPPYNMRKCLDCGFVTEKAWYRDIDGRDRCAFCMRKVKGPQWEQDKRPLEGSYCVIRYAIRTFVTP